MSVVNQPVEDAIGHGRITDLFVPAGHGQLRRENQRADLISVLANLGSGAVPVLESCTRRPSHNRQASRNDLSQFGWQLCRKYTVPEMKTWLRDGSFPEEIRSRDVIHGLSAGAVGTGSESVIEPRIDPQNSGAGAIEIHVFWPDGERLLERVRLRQDARVMVQVLA